MRLEPISERPSQHARCGARRATLHHVVLAVEEIGRVTRIEGHGRETRKWRKLRPRPFPSVSNQIVHAECAGATGMRANRRGIPRLKIKIPPVCARSLFAPGVEAFLAALGRSIRGAMKLRLCGERSPQPFRVRGGLGVTRVNRPFLRQADLAKHGPVQPEVAIASPENRMLDVFLLLPVPSFLTPKRTVLVTTRLDKPKEFVVVYVVLFNRESRRLYCVGFKFIVPPEFIPVNSFQPQRRPPCRYVHQMGLHPQCLPRGAFWPAKFSLARHPVQHISERLRMH